MWSVVTESPSSTRQRASTTSVERAAARAACPGRTTARARRSRPSSQAKSAPSGAGSALPALVAVPDRRVLALEQLGRDAGLDGRAHLAAGRPELAQVDVGARAVGAERLVLEVDVDRARQRVGDDERGRGEVAGAHERVDAALEVAVAREHGADGELVVAHGLGDLVRERARVADAGRAAVADELEAQRVERLLQPGRREVVGDDARAGREARLDVRGGAQPARDGVAGEQAGGDHHGRVGRVGAGRDRGDHDAAVVHELAVGDSRAADRPRGSWRARRPAARGPAGGAGRPGSGRRRRGRARPAC